MSLFRDLNAFEPRALICPPFIVGFILGSILYGILLAQTTFYYSFFTQRVQRSDSQWLRMFVAYIATLETVTTLYFGLIIWKTFITQIPPPSSGTLQVSIPVDAMKFGAFLTVSIPQTPLCHLMKKNDEDYTVRMLKGPRIVAIFICGLIAISFGSGLVMSILVPRGLLPQTATAQIQSDSLPGDPYLWYTVPILTWHSSSAAVDILVNIGLAYTLIRLRSGIPSSDSLVKDIIYLIIETGMLITVCNLTQLGLFTINSV
ncbi:hypothetical protein ONZ45_g4066 [Pleurotus djamor]|nr:hypothetical protein ONZ45_g4066 [Pleurotus djamor]